ncbi:hypothetical protein CICLE_v10007086mg [Citrus x clementina]|uniref:Uncharacterized protein n=1 Tax=Citrus clementina TaxID=85681 RepID=V4S691_CITCL|nr:hypothetical protein CICLE_v10007086mg [Citrus x clementina]
MAKMFRVVHSFDTYRGVPGAIGTTLTNNTALTQSQPKKMKHSQPPSPQPLTQLIALNLPLKSTVIIRLEKLQAMRSPMEAVVVPMCGGMPRIEIHDPHKLDGW